jgi:hypothetical protein
MTNVQVCKFDQAIMQQCVLRQLLSTDTPPASRPPPAHLARIDVSPADRHEKIFVVTLTLTSCSKASRMYKKCKKCPPLQRTYKIIYTTDISSCGQASCMVLVAWQICVLPACQTEPDLENSHGSTILFLPSDLPLPPAAPCPPPPPPGGSLSPLPGPSEALIGQHLRLNPQAALGTKARVK